MIARASPFTSVQVCNASNVSPLYDHSWHSHGLVGDGYAKVYAVRGRLCDEQFYTKEILGWLMMVGGHFGMSVLVRYVSLLVAPTVDQLIS